MFLHRDSILGVREKCSADGFYVCEGMKLAAPEMNGEGRSRGLLRAFGWAVRNGQDEPGPPHFLGVSYRVNKKITLVVDFCPWCGTRLTQGAQPAELAKEEPR